MEMLSRLKCTHCGSSELDRDPSRGDTVCTGCGSVLEESIIVSEVQYGHDSHGATRAIGQLVTADGNVPGGLNLGHTFGLAKESRKITLQNARRKISDLAMKLNLPERCVDMAHNFYKMALAKKFTQGRKNPHVIAACVYLVCRREETPHMLLDLSDVLHINVYELGKTYLKLQSDLCINTPTIDPTMYILRFSHQLDFGKKLEDVAFTASRLLQRMKRDWIHTGRRPSGLCGAALLVAARMHGFNRTVKDMIKVVKVCQATVRKRLCEFSDTPSSRLTLDEFMTIDLEEEQDPPAFKAARKKKDLEIEEQKLEEAQQDVYELQKEIEGILEKTRKQSFARTYAKFFQASSDKPVDDNVVSEMFIANSTGETLDEVVESVEKETEILSTMNNVDEPEEIGIEHNVDGIPSAEYFNELLQPVVPPKNEVLLDESEIPRLLFPDDFKIENKEDCELDITGLDDDELDTYLSTNDEIKSKAVYWFTMNGKYIKERKEKEEKRLKEEAESAKKEPKKKRRRQKREPIHASTTEEAIEKVLAQKKVSLKLDYNVLKNLNTQTESEEVPKEEETVESEDLKPKKPKRIRLPKPKRPQPVIPNSIRQGISDLVAKARYVRQQKERQLSQKQDEDSDGSQDRIQPTKQIESPIEDKVIVQDHKSDDEPSCSNAYDSDEVSDDEIEPEENVHLSAAQLLGNSVDEHEYMYYDE